MFKNNKILLMILMIFLISCKTPPTEPEVLIPDFTAQKPIRPVLESVTLKTPIPSELLRNYSVITNYALEWEAFYEEYQKFLEKQREIYNK